MTATRIDPEFVLEMDGREIRFYQGGFPVHLAREIESLYKNIFSSAEKFEADGNLSSAECYVSTSATGTETILFFSRTGRNIEVLNSAIPLKAEVINLFCRAIFEAFHGVQRVRFEAVECGAVGPALPHQRFNCLENIVITLPDSAVEYLAMLGKSMRASIKRNRKKLEAHPGGFEYQILEGADISGQQIQTLVALSSARISSKNMKPSHTEAKTLRLIRLLQSAGSVVIARMNGEICGGVICTAYGGNYYMHVVAHEAAYRAFSLGKVCIFLSIQHAIERGAKEYHFLWGAYDYKFEFLGQQRDYDRIVVYRSRLWMLLSLPMFVSVATRGYGRQARKWLKKMHQRGTALIRRWQPPPSLS